METCAQKWCSTPAVDTRIVQLKLRKEATSEEGCL